MKYSGVALRRVAPWLVLLAATAASLPASANDPARPGAEWGGSFAQSCTDIDVDKHGRLSATCLRKNGKANRTNLTDKECPGHQAGNNDGKLVCEAAATGGSGGGGGQANGSSGRWEGSFKQSCRDFSVNEDGTLSATCQTRSGSWRNTSLARVNCTSNRADNDDGRLVCESQRVGMNKWEGSFERTCRDIYMNNEGTLTATCPTTNGEWNRSWLSTKNCSSYTAANKNGQLVCEPRGGVSSNAWDGSFKQTCRDVSVNADGTLRATCQTKSGTWRQASLARINCTDRRAKNVDGRLACESQRVGMNRWDGSYEKSCRDIYMDAAGTLTAKCQSTTGAWVPAQLSARECGSYRASNNNGRLVCEQQTSQR
jgi:hypothetical protein